MQFSDRINQVYNLIEFIIKSSFNRKSDSKFIQETTEALKEKIDNTNFIDIESRRNELIKSEDLIDVLDLGANSSSKTQTKKMHVSYIGEIQAKPAYQSKVLFKLIKSNNPKTVVELGTSAGMTSCYISKAISNKCEFYTIEGCPNIFNLGQETFKKTNCNNITHLQGDFDSVLPDLLKKLNTIDLLYIDGNHSYEATLKYFKLALSHINENSIIVFDDIYWSKGMQNSWNEIKQNEAVSHTFDLFYFGIVFFRKNNSKEHHYLRVV